MQQLPIHELLQTLNKCEAVHNSELYSARSIPKGYTQSFPVLSMSQYETKTVWTRLRDKAYRAFVMLLGIGLITGILPLLACGLIMHACGMEWA